MTYHYHAGTHEDDDREPIRAECDYCDTLIDPDSWKDAENGLIHWRGQTYMEHVCSVCRILGNMERADHERAHERGRM